MNNKYFSHSTFTYFVDTNIVIQTLRYILGLPDFDTIMYSHYVEHFDFIICSKFLWSRNGSIYAGRSGSYALLEVLYRLKLYDFMCMSYVLLKLR